MGIINQSLNVNTAMIIIYHYFIFRDDQGKKLNIFFHSDDVRIYKKEVKENIQSFIYNRSSVVLKKDKEIYKPLYKINILVLPKTY